MIDVLDGWFLDLGFPKTIRSDGGPQFRADFDTYCTNNNIKHETSSPYHPESNGLAEAAVKNMKRLIIKCRECKEDFHRALLEWKNTPNDTGYSPAQAFLGRRQRSALPALYQPEVTTQEVHTARQDQKESKV